MTIGNSLNASYLHVSTSTSASRKDTNENSSSQKNAQSTTEKLTEAQKTLIAQLRAVDAKVHAHEMAHISAGGGVITSAANYSYEKGPDNRLYAVAGEVGIDTSRDATPEETISKMQTVRTAALAPSDPSPTDYQVASTASMLEMQSRLELARIQQAALLAKSKESYTSANNQEETSLFSNYA